jgi:hypothetical protein
VQVVGDWTGIRIPTHVEEDLSMNVIVCTSINPPTEAVRRFDALQDWHLVVVGDRKTPADYRLERGTYLSPAEQEAMDPRLSEAIGWNCIARRNFGFLWANHQRAEIVAVVDDDNIPQANWGKELLIGKPVEVDYYDTDLPAFDPVGATNYPHLWHRGYPLQLLQQRDYSRKSRRQITAGVQADFWNGDPDIDAICRLEHAPECTFEPASFPLASNSMAPFNSQNTFLQSELLRDYFMFPFTGRMEDIWAAYYLQATRGVQVVFGAASVYQDRNSHHLIRDMQAEYLGYENNLELVTALAIDAESIVRFLPGRSWEALRLYRKHFA